MGPTPLSQIGILKINLFCGLKYDFFPKTGSFLSKNHVFGTGSRKIVFFQKQSAQII